MGRISSAPTFVPLLSPPVKSCSTAAAGLVSPIQNAAMNHSSAPPKASQGFGWICLLLASITLVSLGAPGISSAQEGMARPVKAGNGLLQPGDLIRLRIWREPDLSGDFRVDETGAATFPKIGPLPVSQLSTDSLKSLLVSSYDRYLQNPSVEVVFLRRVNVLGAVKSPGLYDVDPTMTVADVVALAGGVTPDGQSKKVELIRPGELKARRLSLQSRLTDSPLRSGDQLRVPQRSWLARNGTVVAAGITAAAIITTAVIRP